METSNLAMQDSDNQVRLLNQVPVVAALVVPHGVHVSWTKPGVYCPVATAMLLRSSDDVSGPKRLGERFQRHPCGPS